MSYSYRTISNNPEERQRVIYPYCFWENAFSPEEIDKICNMMSAIPLSTAAISSINENKLDEQETPGPILNNDVRRSMVSFHLPNEENGWIFERLNYVIEMINNRWYNVDINGYDQFQYTEYHDHNQGHYGWHSDIFFGPPPADSHTETRKLSLTLLLNEPEIDFEGGELQFGHESKQESVKMKKGTIVVFPSFSLHRVAPVTRGIRKSIVVWTIGPKWK
jgi:PKHD-type hydroxylase